MPKINDEYVEKKKDEIKECALFIINEKPLYQVKMRDIIKRMGFSQGAIYKYYKNVEDIYVDIVNTTTKEANIVEKVEKIKKANISIMEKMEKYFKLLSNYIINIQNEIGGKVYFELLLTYSFDKDKSEKFLSSIVFKQNIKYMEDVMIDNLNEGVKQKLIEIKIPLESLIMFTEVCIDGITYNYALSLKEKNIKIDVKEMFKIMIQSIFNYIVEI